MCMKRDADYDLRDMCNSWVIDVTLEDIVEIEDSFENPINDQWNYPYNLLPSSDEEEPREFIIIDQMENSNEDYAESETTTNDSSNEVNQNVIIEGTSRHLNEGQEFEVDVPLILLSMSRISNNLFERAAASRD